MAVLFNLDTAIKRFGGVPALAEELGVSHQIVYKWEKRGWVPPARAVEIEKKTKVPRSKLINPQLAKLLNI
jgi:DNA-binding transcriptional regulator YdaS (Cro superfamily)